MFKRNKLLASALALGMAFTAATAATGCKKPSFDDGGSDHNKAYDPTKTQVQVFTYNAGFKDEWLWQLEADFEEANKDTVYEEGKKGVQIHHEGAMKQFSSDDIKNSNFDVFFFEGGDYYSWRQSGALEDLTGIVTATNKYDNKTIKSKMNEKQISYFGGLTSENAEEKYYAVPHYKGAMGIIYNVEIFDEYGFYISDSETTSLISKTNPNKSKGPDGKTGTENGVDYSMDDGLPATYDEFFYLCGQMLKRTVTPFVLPGTFTDYYVNILYNALQAEYEGLEQMELNLSFKGEATDLIKVNDAGTAIVKDSDGNPVIESATIDYTNGYDVFRQAGKYYALDFVKKLVGKEAYYNEDGFNTAFTQTDAQETFLKSGTDMSVSDEKYAMLVDGSWWEAEANVIFNNMAKKDDKYSKQNRKFGWMPLPKANKAKLKEGNNVFLDYLEASVCVKANLGANKQAALDFVQYVCSDGALDKFTDITHALKDFNYEVSEETYKNANYFTETLINYNKKSETFSYYSNSPFYLKNRSDLISTKVNTIGVQPGTPTTILKDGVSAKNGEDYFLKSYSYWKKRGSAFWKEV